MNFYFDISYLRVELAEVILLEFLLHLLDVGEVAGGDAVLVLQGVVTVLQLLQQLLLLVLLAHHRHLGLEVREDQGVNLGQAGALDQVIQAADSRESWKTLRGMFGKYL